MVQSSKPNLLSLILFTIFLSTTPTKLFSSLLPENVVQIGKNKYKEVQDLCPEDLIVTLNDNFGPKEFCRTRILDLQQTKSSRYAVSIELQSENGNAGSITIGQDQKFFNIDAFHELKNDLRHSAKNKEQYLEFLLEVVWVDARNLQVGDRIQGGQGSSLTVTSVKEIEFDHKQNFYKLSLKHHHTFYLVDSGGNCILTHNEDGIIAHTIFGTCITSLISYIFEDSPIKGLIYGLIACPTVYYIIDTLENLLL